MRALIQEIEPTKVEAPDEETLGVAVETLEGMEGLLARLPAAERRETLSGVALERSGALWFPTARNCRLSAGVAVERDGFVSFAVGDESSADEALVAYFSARIASAHALQGARDRTPETGTDEDTPIPGELSAAERRRVEANRKRLRTGFVSRRRRGEELAVRPTYEIDASRDVAREAHRTEGAELERRTERARRSGRASYDTARAVYLQQLPALAHRLLHLLRREGGAIREQEFVSRYAKLADARAAEPEAVLVVALRELAGAGKVRRLRNRGTGEVFLAAIEPLDEGRFRRNLNGLIRDSRFGIVGPWAETDGVEPEGEEDEEALLSSNHEDVFPEEPGRRTFLENVADEGAQEEIEALTA